MIKNVFDKIASFEALEQAEHDTAAGRRYLPQELTFWEDKEDNLHRISEMLYNGVYPPDTYHTFPVYEPKVRKIVASDYYTKIIQRSVYNALNSELAKGWITDTYACIDERGNLNAAKKLASWVNYCAASGRQWYHLKADCEKFFYRIYLQTLMRQYAKKISDHRTLDLLEHYTLHASKPFGIPRGVENPMLLSDAEMLWDRGVATGGGMSHMSGNVYFDPFDQYAKRNLHLKFYIRCMDDIDILLDDKERLHEVYYQLKEFLETKLLLNFNHKTAIRPIEDGIEFVGYFIKPGSMRIRKQTSLHMKHRLSNIEELYSRGDIDFSKANETVQSYIAMMDHTDSTALRKKIFSEFVLTHDREHLEP